MNFTNEHIIIIVIIIIIVVVNNNINGDNCYINCFDSTCE